MMQKKYILLIVTLICGTSQLDAFRWCNLFNPYDWLLIRYSIDRGCHCLNASYEHLFNARSYQADENESCGSNQFRKRADILQLFQDEQDFLAALKGSEFEAEAALLAQKYNLNDDDSTIGICTPCGNLEADNFMFSYHYQLPHQFFLTLYLPIVRMQLKNVRWIPSRNTSSKSFEDNFTNNLITGMERFGGLCLYNWRRIGVGDLTLQASWGKRFLQRRPWLKQVRLHLRGGVTIPTGKKEDDNIMFGTPFGTEGGGGFMGAGTLEFRFGQYLTVGGDVELVYAFGNTRARRIKTDVAQTDFLFINKAIAYKSIGFTEHFTLFAEATDFWKNLSLSIAYQYTKQQDDELFINNYRTDHFVLNSAQKLQEWTTHSIVAGIHWDGLDSYEPTRWGPPRFTFMVKHGFNGQRAILADTVTFSFEWDF